MSTERDRGAEKGRDEKLTVGPGQDAARSRRPQEEVKVRRGEILGSVGRGGAPDAAPVASDRSSELCDPQRSVSLATLLDANAKVLGLVAVELALHLHEEALRAAGGAVVGISRPPASIAVVAAVVTAAAAACC